MRGSPFGSPPKTAGPGANGDPTLGVRRRQLLEGRKPNVGTVGAWTVMSAKRSGKGAGARKEAGPSTWTIDYYVVADGSVPVLDWARGLPEPKRVAWLAFVEFALVPQGKDIEQSGYVKSLGKGLFELRVDHDAAELAQVFGTDLSAYPELAGPAGAGILLRVFCTFHGDRVVLLLSGLDKGADPKAQPRAIRAARKLLAEWQAEQAAWKRRGRAR